MTADGLKQQLELPEVGQVGVVVEDLDRAASFLESSFEQAARCGRSATPRYSSPAKIRSRIFSTAPMPAIFTYRGAAPSPPLAHFV